MVKHFILQRCFFLLLISLAACEVEELDVALPVTENVFTFSFQDPTNGNKVIQSYRLERYSQVDTLEDNQYRFVIKGRDERQGVDVIITGRFFLVDAFYDLEPIFYVRSGETYTRYSGESCSDTRSPWTQFRGESERGPFLRFYQDRTSGVCIDTQPKPSRFRMSPVTFYQ